MMAALAAALAIPVGLGALTGVATAGETRGPWYQGLRKPSWQPPKSWFGPVWTALYLMMGLASWLVWSSGSPAAPAALGLYAFQLVLNLAWSLLFFKAKRLDWALADILALLPALVATAWAFYGVDPLAGALMVPYAAWTAFATALTVALYVANPAGGSYVL